jgi:hypothetical protein
MADRKKDEIMAKGLAEAAYVSFQIDPKSASKPEGFRNIFPDSKTSWESLNEKKRTKYNHLYDPRGRNYDFATT